MRRRRMVALLGSGLSSLAGCSSLWRRNEGAVTRTRSPTETTPSVVATTETAEGGNHLLEDDRFTWRTVGETVSTPGTWTVRVAEVSVQPTVHAVASPGPGSVTRRVLVEPGKQFVVATVTVGRASDAGGPTPRADSLLTGLLVDGDPVDGEARSTNGPSGGQHSVRMAHPVRIVEAERAAVAVRSLSRGGEGWPGANWRLPEDTVTKLASRPRFTVESVEAPARVAPGDVIETTVSVANRGSRDGTFRAWLAIDDWAIPVTVPVSVGETANGTVSVRPDPDVETVSLRLSWGTGSVVRTVDIEN